ncbi:acylneuraminate cytidylyltransferase family protein [Candidatus Woesearchaeota archaeon]|nr:acylneuraminate cytidylyltransferase family protein [Candidatus Woesearchaeota archaeon]
MKIVGIIPARGGSKGIPGKNIKMIAGKPLIAWTIEAAKESKLLDDFFVSTDDKKIAEISKQYSAKIIERPPELATDDADMMDALNHALDITKADVIVLLQPPSPVRDKGLIDMCIKRFIDKGADSLATGYMSTHFEYGSYSDNRQNLKPYFHDDGNIYIWSSELINNKQRKGNNPEIVEISREQNFEIDEEFDFWINEQILKKRIEDGYKDN